MTQPRCNGTNKQGEQCRGNALPDSRYCIAHDPAKVVDIAAARRKGGQASSTRAKAKRAMEGAAMTPAELEGIIAVTLKAVLSGHKSPAIGSAIASLCRAAVAVRETTELEARLTILEDRIARLGGERRA